MHESGVRLNCSNITKSNLDLYKAAHRIFGGWEQAITEAGLKYNNISKKEEWNKEKIIQEIQVLNKNGISLTISGLNKINRKSLYWSASRYFGNWSNALKVAGVEK